MASLFLHFCNYLPFKQDLALCLKNFDTPLPKDDLYKVSLKLACWLEKILKNFQCISTISPSPLEKGIALHMNKFESPLPKDDLCQLWLQLA
jgi:hypothetical protein